MKQSVKTVVNPPLINLPSLFTSLNYLREIPTNISRRRPLVFFVVLELDSVSLVEIRSRQSK